MQALDALGNPTRRQVLELLKQGEHTVQSLADQLPVSRPAVSRHLRLLTEAGLVRHRAEGARNLYALRPEGFDALRAYLDSFWDDALARFKLVAENVEDDGV
ncbi:MAG: winged helix-turn-helix transcriptional regulator [Proteobacteria bacterium]|nr:winged helix-turn-helix transcriptional regulator [Pseudomonadota bacterium]